jgi:dTDP-glucose 4,6-dehydratase
MMSARDEALVDDCRRSITASGVKGLEPLRGSRVLITGGTGFVGTWLLATLAHLNDAHGFGVEVTAFARFPSRMATQAPFLVDRPDIRLIEADVRQFVEPPAGLQWIVHAAADPDSRHHATKPIETASVIAEGTARVLRMAEQANGLRGVLHFSSGLVHAARDIEGKTGGARVGASAVYAESKAFSEALCAAYRTQSRLPIVITRPYTFLGPFQSLDAPWAANNFLHAALHGQPLKLLGGGDAARSYLYGSDMAVLALHQLVGGRSGDTFDLGGTEELSLLGLAQAVVTAAARPLEIRVNTSGKDPGMGTGANRFVPDITPSTRAFGFDPVFTPAQAIARTLAWHSPAQSGQRRAV